MSRRPWTRRSWVVAVVSTAAHSTAGSLAVLGAWWPAVVLAGVWLVIGLCAWWIWRVDQRRINEYERWLAARLTTTTEEPTT